MDFRTLCDDINNHFFGYIAGEGDDTRDIPHQQYIKHCGWHFQTGVTMVFHPYHSTCSLDKAKTFMLTTEERIVEKEKHKAGGKSCSEEEK